MNTNLKNFLLLLLLACCWGPSFLFMKVAIPYIPPMTITAIRLLIGSVSLFIILKLKNIALPKPNKSWRHLFVAGLLQSAIPFSLFAAGEKYIDSGMAAMICGASPLFTLFLAHFFTDNDKISKAKSTGAAIGFFGLLVLVFPALFNVKADFLGVVIILAGSICYSMAFVYTKKHVRGFKHMVAPTIQLFLGFLFLLPWVIIIERPFAITHVSWPAIFSVMALGFIGAALAFVVYYKILEATNSTYLSMVNYITPALGAFLGVIVLGEKLSWNSYLGCAMILLGVMIANGVIRISKNKH